MNDRLLHPEKVRVQVALADPVAYLAGQAGVELILRHGFEHRAAGVRLGVFEVERHVEGLRGDRHLVHFFPRHFQVRTAGADDPHLRVNVAVALVRTQRLGDGVVERGPVARQPLCATEARLHRALVLVDRIKTAQHVAHDKPRAQTEQDTSKGKHQREMRLVMDF